MFRDDNGRFGRGGGRLLPSPTAWLAGRTRPTTLAKAFGGGVAAVIVGVALFFFPTPFTSILGLALVLLGVFAMVGSTFLGFRKVLP